jgi:hypothetical protein
MKLLVFDNKKFKRRKLMKTAHKFLWIAVLLSLGYLAGVAFPKFGKPIVSKVGLGG